MDLNIYLERKKEFDFKKFKEQVSLFLLRNQIKSAHSSDYFKEALMVLNTIIRQNILEKEEINLDKNLEKTFTELHKFEKSELYENLQNNEKGIFSSLLNFVQQYIKATKENNFFLNDQIIVYETFLIKADLQEMFNFSKNYFALAIRSQNFSFDNIIKKEIENFEKKYNFKDIFFRKALTVRDKIILLKNFKTLDMALQDMANELDVPTSFLSLNGLISISFEPIILGYSSASAYMSKLEDSYIISLGKYDDILTLKKNYFHEFAHCLDHTSQINNNKMTFSEQALLNLKEKNAETVIEKIMEKELGFENYHFQYKEKFEIMQKEIYEVIKEEFGVVGEIDFTKAQTKDDNKFIIDNYFKIEVYKLMHILVVQALFEKNDFIQAMRVKNNEVPKEQLQEKFNAIEEKINTIRNKHGYVVSKNVSFFLSEEKRYLLETDRKEKKQYYTKPLEIFARAFETYYKNEESPFYTFVEEHEKEKYKELLKEIMNYILPKNDMVTKRIMK